MTDQKVPEVLPPAQKVTGLYLDQHALVHLQYQSAEKLHELVFTLDEFLRLEDWLIKLREQAGSQKRTDSPPESPVR